MSNTEWLQKLHDAIKTDKKWNRINYGGCAWFAALIGEKQQGSKCVILHPQYMCDQHQNFKVARSSIDPSNSKIEFWESHGYTFYHVVYALDDSYVYDAEYGVILLSELREIYEYAVTGEISVEECRALAEQKSAWNHAFTYSMNDAHEELKKLIDSTWDGFANNSLDR